MACNRGDVVLVPFPFTDLKSAKARPTVVINDQSYEAVSGNLILIMITSQAKKFLTDHVLVDWTAAGLKKPSVVRKKIAPISTALVLLTVGQITPMDLTHLETQLRMVLNLYDLSFALLDGVSTRLAYATPAGGATRRFCLHRNLKLKKR